MLARDDGNGHTACGEGEHKICPYTVPYHGAHSRVVGVKIAEIKEMSMSTELFFPPDGITTFARSPLARPGDPIAADVMVLGVPWDGGTGLRGGARHGPRAIREASLRCPLWADGRPTGYWD